MFADRDQTLQQRSFGLKQFVLDAQRQVVNHKHIDHLFGEVAFFGEGF